MQAFLDSSTFTWVILPLLIFIARICDMSLDTMRIIMIGQGRKLTATLIAFVEVCIWLMVARQVITHLPNWVCFFAYAGGFAAGNYVGLLLEEHIALGVRMVRVVIPQDGSVLFEALKKEGFGVTSLSAQGAKGPVQIIYTVVQRNEVQRVVALIKQVTPSAFFTIEDVKQVNAGVFPSDYR